MRVIDDREGGAGMAFLYGAAHALDFAGALLDDGDWRGFAADAEAIGGYWEVAVASAAGHRHAARAHEEE